VKAIPALSSVLIEAAIRIADATTGLEEVLDEDYLRYRVEAAAYVRKHLDQKKVSLLRPPGGHAVYLDARRFLPHVPLADD